MHDPFWMLLSTLCALLALVSILVILWLIRTLVRVSSQSSLLPLQLLREQQVENQKLRNLILSPDLPTLAGLNHATLPANSVASNDTADEVVELEDLNEAINYEERLASSGYSLGDVGYDLESAGWAQPVVKRADGDPIAFDPS